MNRRDFVRQGALWVGGALIVEPVIKRLWAFPKNPLAAKPGSVFGTWDDSTPPILCSGDMLHFEIFQDSTFGIYAAKVVGPGFVRRVPAQVGPSGTYMFSFQTERP